MKSIAIISSEFPQVQPLTDILSHDYLIKHSQLERFHADSHLRAILIDAVIAANAPTQLAQLQRTNLPIIVLCQHEAQYPTVADIATDYLVQPWHTSTVMAKINTHVHIAEIVQGSFNGDIENTPRLSDREQLNAAQEAAILCLASVARIRDHATGNHILRTQHYVKALAEYLRYHPDYQADLDNNATIELFYKTASLHDIGKVAIPDAILQKEGELTPDEYEIMKKHTCLGFDAIHSAQKLLPHEARNSAGSFLRYAQQVTLSHHERWDGSGYPQGIAGDEIPVVARLMAVADVYDAIISRRPYKHAMSHEAAANIILQGSGSLFDPRVVAAFCDLQETFRKVSIILEEYFPSLADPNESFYCELP